ncbi:MAG: hypothetical protein AAGB23_14265 [Pseudomonadota bacterium]
MPEPGAIGAAHVLGWVVTALAFAGNLFWNWRNRQHIDETAQQIRVDQHKRDVWDRHRSRIEERLEGLTSFVAKLPSQVAAMMPREKKDKAVPLKMFILELNAEHDALSSALSDTDDSAYCHGSRWAEKAYGDVSEQESSWDVLLERIQKASRCRKLDNQIDILTQLQAPMREIELAVRAEIRENEFCYQP